MMMKFFKNDNLSVPNRFLEQINRSALNSILISLIVTMPTRIHYPFVTAVVFAVLGKRYLTHSSVVTPCQGNKPLPTFLYSNLKIRLQEIENLNGIRGLVGWDEMVMMKDGSSNARNNQKAAIAAVIHEKSTHEELKKLIQDLESADLNQLESEYDRAVVRDAARDYRLATGKTKEQTMREAELEGAGYQAWVEARANNNFAKFEPILKQVVDLKKEIAASTHPGLDLYDANIDAYERGMKSKRLDEILLSTKTRLAPLIKKVCESPVKAKYEPPAALKGSEYWDVNKQAAMCTEVAEAIGFDFTKGRLDVSVHPFTGGSHPTDTRITTRYSTGDWLQGVAGTVHEVGHALYEQGRNPTYDNLPVSRALSMGVHESQSLLWERMIFQSPEFWHWITPIVHKHFPHTSDVTADQFYEFVNQAHPSFIRVDADELTYPLHIVLRYEIEKCLFDGTITTDMIPTIWNQKMKESLNIVVDKDSQGCLQDIHWSLGSLGYFPSYTLGAMIAAQLFETAEKQIPDLKTQIRNGQFKPLREWLRVNIHEVRSLYDSPDKLLTVVTGQPLDPVIYVNYLDKKYTDLYKL